MTSFDPAPDAAAGRRLTRLASLPGLLVPAALLLAAPVAAPASAQAPEAQAPDAEAMIARIEAGSPEAEPGDVEGMSMEQLMEHFAVPGVSVAVIHDFEVHWARGWGVADVETGARVDAETLFQAASMSKPVAAMGSLKAVQDGLFGLDDDIDDILTTWHLDGGEMTADQPVTPRNLMSHTSGLGDAFGFPGYEPDAPLPTVVQIFEGEPPSNVRRLFMERRPYEAYEYSGGGVTLMQQALADARGRPFEEILHDDVLEPLEMTRSSFRQPISPELDRNAARAHDDQGRSMGPKWHVYPEMAAAGLWTTPTDLARFLVEVQRSVRGESNRVLSPALAREMITPVGVGDFAVGFALSKMGEGWYFQHGGANWGFRGTMVAHTRKGYGLAIMTNADQGSALAGEVGRRIQEAYAWDSMQPPVPRGYAPPVEREAIDLPVEVLERYVGVYEVEGGPTLTVALEDGRLMLDAEGQGRFPLFAESEGRFFLTIADVVLTFTTDEAGIVDGVEVLQQGRSMQGRKVDVPAALGLPDSGVGRESPDSAASGPFAPGRSTVEVELDGLPLDLWVYKPDNYVGDGFIVLFHGASRAAEAYRDNARGFADTFGRLVVVPHFDAERFPSRLYQFGGALREDGSLASADERTFRFVPAIVERIRAREGRPDMPYLLLGYSAGAQFLERMAAFLDTDAERLIAMSPGSSLFPTRDLDYGLGFGGLPEAWSSDERIRRYLSLPLTIAIGSADVEEGQLPRGDAFDQGVHRYSRNLRWFTTAMDLAHTRGWDFNWRLVIHHGAGHPPPEMFDHPQIGNTLFGHRRR